MKFRNVKNFYSSGAFWLGLLLLGLAVSLTPVCSAQGEASIQGTVSDSTGGAIGSAAVHIKSLETGAERNLITDGAGRYDAASLLVGHYEVRAEKNGFRSQEHTGILLVVGQRETVDLVLQVGDVRQTVRVEAVPDAVSVNTEDVSGLVGEREVKDLPLNGRSYDQLMTLNPGVVNYTSQRSGGIGTSNSVVGNMFAVSGRRPQENLFLLNGVEFTSASEINNTPGGVSGQLLGVDAVREFSVVKDSYGAEYGKRPGAQINIVTASGTNQLHGDVYEFLRNSALDARNYFDFGNIPEFRRNDFGGSLGGPIRKDKTFLFGNYEGFRQNLGLSDLSLVPDAASRAGAVPSVQPLLALWPVANGPEILTSKGAPSGIAKAFSNPLQRIREDFGTARVDQIFTDKDSLAGVYTIDDSNANSPTNNPFTWWTYFCANKWPASVKPTFFLRASSTKRPSASRAARSLSTAEPQSLCPAGSTQGSRWARSLSAAARRSTVHRRSQTAVQMREATCAWRGISFTLSDQVTLHSRQAFVQLRWVARENSIQRHPCARSVRTGFVHQSADFPARQSEHLHLRSELHAVKLAIA